MNIESFQVNEKVMVKIPNLRSKTPNAEHFVEGIVTSKGMIYPSHGSKHPPYASFKVKYIHTYYRKLSDKYNGLVWVGEEGEIYDKENESLFFYESTIKKAN